MQSAWEREAAPGGGVIFPHWLRLVIGLLEGMLEHVCTNCFPARVGNNFLGESQDE